MPRSSHGRHRPARSSSSSTAAALCWGFCRMKSRRPAIRWYPGLRSHGCQTRRATPARRYPSHRRRCPRQNGGGDIYRRGWHRADRCGRGATANRRAHPRYSPPAWKRSERCREEPRSRDNTSRRSRSPPRAVVEPRIREGRRRQWYAPIETRFVLDDSINSETNSAKWQENSRPRDTFRDRDHQMNILEQWFAPDFGKPSFLVARWIWLRALGGIFFSVFYSLYFQIHGLIGPNGILPATAYLDAVRSALGLKRYWLLPSLLWINAGDRALDVLVWTGLIASVAIMLNLWPRGSIAVAGICFLSFIAVAQDFAAYQSDGMLLEAALISIFFAPRGLRPGLGADQPPSRASLFMLRWEWFRIYFESGLVKILSGETQWRNLTAMDKYYENGPLPSWIGWHVQQWPHGFHAATAATTLIVELFVAWLVFFP